MSADVIYPGPAEVDPNQIPGGIVFHAYAVPTQRLLHTSLVGPDELAVEATAERDADKVLAALTDDETGACLVAFDGDTGQRITAREALS